MDILFLFLVMKILQLLPGWFLTKMVLWPLSFFLFHFHKCKNFIRGSVRARKAQIHIHPKEQKYSFLDLPMAGTGRSIVCVYNSIGWWFVNCKPGRCNQCGLKFAH